MATDDEKVALLLGALYRLGDGDMTKYFTAEPVPDLVDYFLDNAPSMGARRAALVAILESIIDDET